MAQVLYQGTGRRKTSIARVRIVPGDGKLIVNGQPMEEYFDTRTQQIIARQPLELTKMTGRFDVIANVDGGGSSGQAGAIRLGLARALIKADPNLRPFLKKAGSRKPAKLHSTPSVKVQVAENSVTFAFLKDHGDGRLCDNSQNHQFSGQKWGS